MHHLLLDPRNPSERLIPDVYHETNVQGLGLMYRVIDLPHMIDLLGECDLGLPLFGVRKFTLKLTVDDSFLPENAGSLLLRCEDGHLERSDRGSHDTEIHLDIADFSSLLAGTVDFRSLYRYGLADISSPKYVETVNRIFAVAQKPICTTSF